MWMVIASSVIQAQDSVGKSIEMKWSGVFFGDDLPEVFLMNGAREEKLNVPAFALSPLAAYHGANPLRVYRKIKSVAPGKPDVLESIGSVALNPDWTRTLLFFFPQPDGHLGIKAIRDDDPLKNGGLRVINGTHADIGLKVNLEKSRIKPAEIKYFSLPADMTQVAIRYALQQDHEWKWVGGNFFRLVKQGRCTVVIVRTDAMAFKSTNEQGESFNGSQLQVFSFEQAAPTNK